MTFSLSKRILTDNLSVEVLSNGREYLVQAHIGEDVAAGIVYSAVVSLVAEPPLPEGTMELEVGITAAHADPTQSEWITDGAITKQFLKGDDRKTVLALTCAMAVEVARVANPDTITLVTSVAYLPDKALTKYGFVCKALRDADYYGGRGNAFTGINIWMLKKRDR